jgi:2-C-methyl-D-erythritol 4-phosphate cytidylyltransferase/2-C-methyl-D-erythritol 2,4-cyclodiphosphate synthase
MSRTPVIAVVVAAGRGARATGTAAPKQYVRLGGTMVLTRTIRAYAAHPAVDAIQVVIHADDRALYDEAIAELSAAKLRPPVIGGATRQASVLAGLEALAASSGPAASVLIHDAARPFVDAGTISRVIGALVASPGAIAAEPVTDTLKRTDAAGLATATIERAGLWRAQTPQGFGLAAILEAHRSAASAGFAVTDDAAIAEWAGLAVQIVPGSSANVKITTLEDIAMAERQLRSEGPGFETRTGQGFDVHRFTSGDHVWLGGVKIAHTHALDGHSDADVALHALTDALLGTIGDGDIGQHFPPSDPQWKGAASHLFLTHAAERVRARGGRIVNVDLTILCEGPRIGPHRAAIQARIGELLGLGPDRVGVKATTTEQLGFTGRREGIAAMAIATVAVPRER